MKCTADSEENSHCDIGMKGFMCILEAWKNQYGPWKCPGDMFLKMGMMENHSGKNKRHCPRNLP